ncbi:hypothetical protein A0128_05355 [Leptospira tipperaryensis]|uniref:Uncharacterized protein n=1 Tax=Leptospira tipperaryensis TaxID=2564040 RepID=A0A1D7UUN9_9LEPT|nr:hypothetical protein [Leptospira tipperaryensis]AOP33322.1 hypothetical protein A0128_05355 [Leptospira tipperaryensis]
MKTELNIKQNESPSEKNKSGDVVLFSKQNRSFPLKTKYTKNKIVTATMLIGFLVGFSNCEKDKKDDITPLLALAAIPAQATDLPQPALNTASLKLGSAQFTLTDVQFCRLGIGNIGIIIGQTPTTYLPGLNIHGIDPTKTTVTIGAGGSQMDIDTAVGVYMAGKNKVAGSCSATVKENSATVYDLQAIDCPITDELGGNAPDTTVSFRARCTKQ